MKAWNHWPQETYETMKPLTPRNLWNHETIDTTKPMKPRNTWNYVKRPWWPKSGLNGQTQGGKQRKCGCGGGGKTIKLWWRWWWWWRENNRNVVAVVVYSFNIHVAVLKKSWVVLWVGSVIVRQNWNREFSAPLCVYVRLFCLYIRVFALNKKT